jgi:putative transposase
VVADVDQAFQAFSRRVKAGEKPGYPRFKGRNRFSSFGLKEYGNGFKLDGRPLRIHGVGRVAVRWHRPLPCTPKTVRIVRKADGWYAMFTCEIQPVTLPPTGRDVRIDVGVIHAVATSDGKVVPSPKYYRRAQRQFRIQQRRVARRKKGGANRRKAVQLLARQHLHVARQRKDFVDKLVCGLVQTYDHTAIEAFEIRNMARNQHLSKSIVDSG